MKEMLKDDEALGLNHTSAASTPASDDAGSILTDSEMDEEESDINETELLSAATVADLARDLAGLQLESIPVATSPLEEESSRGKGKVGKRAKIVVHEEERSDVDEFEGMGMTMKKGRKAKAKGKKMRSGSATPNQEDDIDDPPLEASTSSLVTPRVDEPNDDVLPAIKKSRRAKKTPASSSGVATPVEVEVGKAGAAVEIAVGVDDGTKEISKKDKRRAKDAAKQGVVDELVRFFSFSFIHFSRR